MPKDDTAIQLRSADQSHRVGIALTIASYALLAIGLPGLLLTAVILLILMPGVWVSGIALTSGLLPLLLGLFLRSRSRHATTMRDRALEKAYAQSILDTLRASSVERNAESIAQLIGLPLDRTESLLMTLNAGDRMTSRVTDEGELLYGVTEPPRLRVADATGEPTPDIVDAEFEAPATVDDHSRHRR